MKTTCLINNYNYANFIEDAVKSVLDQTVKFDEIIIVDDCSTDKSVELLKNKYVDSERIKLILKQKNEGQLSCFNKGFAASQGDIIFFLDSDDEYKPNYLEETLKFYHENLECDFLFCGYEKFGSSNGVVQRYRVDRDLGYSLVVTYHTQKWIGSKTSTLSLRRRALSHILPIPFLADWRTRADDCLIWGASLVGARKFYMSKALVRYRVHGRNDHKKYNTLQKDSGYLYRRLLSGRKISSYLTKKMSYGSDFLWLASLEFKTIPNPDHEEFNSYFKMISSSRLPLTKRLKVLASLLKHFLLNGDWRLKS
ncbi:MAG: glycosyltransferase family 2 protein [Cyanothece sp. SIO1E1]|nr:glycosyltransferase family 2 protein [Cyanothece sp. SIO1E1]